MTDPSESRRPASAPPVQSSGTPVSFSEIRIGSIGSTQKESSSRSLDEEIGEMSTWKVTTPWRSLIMDRETPPEARRLMLSALICFETGALGGAQRDLGSALDLVAKWAKVATTNLQDRIAPIHIALAQVSAVAGDRVESQQWLGMAMTVLRGFVIDHQFSDLALECLNLVESMSTRMAAEYEIPAMIAELKRRRALMGFATTGSPDFVESAKALELLRQTLWRKPDVIRNLGRDPIYDAALDNVMESLKQSAGVRLPVLKALVEEGLTPEQRRLLDAASMDVDEASRVATWLLGVLLKAQETGHDLAVVSVDDDILLRVTL